MTNPEQGQNLNAENKIPLRDRPIDEVAGVLQDVLGQVLVAYGLNERDPQRIGSFARSEEAPAKETEKILRDLAEVLEVLRDKDSDDLARAIMIGMNPALDDQAPIEVIRNGESDRVVSSAPHLLGD